MRLPTFKLPKKPKYKKFGEDINFFQLFKKIEKNFDTCFIFESLGEDSQISRYSVIGFDPELIVSANDQQLSIFDKNKDCKTYDYSKKDQNPYEALRNIFPTSIISKKYCGGLVGYMSYEAVNYFEPSLMLKIDTKFDGFKFGIYTDGLVFDKMTGEVFYFYYRNSRFDEIRKIGKSELEPTKVEVKYVGDTATKKEHSKVVEKVKEDIKSGLVFQCEVGFKSRYEIKGDSMNIYEHLRKINPSPHMYYLKFSEFTSKTNEVQQIIGASPELLFRLSDGAMETFPLAGTVGRGKNENEDRILARKLLNDPKEIAEHSMLIDLHRNDIGKVAKFGTVKVRSQMEIKKFSHVQHISSEIVGIVDKDNNMYSALASNFPAGTLTGAPKIEAMKIIKTNEVDPRGPYGGAVGHFGFNGECTFAIPIRTIFMVGEYAYVQTCGGNVFDSNAEDEYEEIQKKLTATKIVLDKFKKQK